MRVIDLTPKSYILNFRYNGSAAGGSVGNIQLNDEASTREVMRGCHTPLTGVNKREVV